MSFIPVAGGCKVELVYVVGLQRVENVYWIKKTGGGNFTAADLDTVSGVFYAWENLVARLRRHTGTHCDIFRATAMHSPGAPFVEYVMNLNGSLAGTNIPTVATVAVKHGTGLSGRSFRGRSYWIGLATGQVASVDTITATAQVDLIFAYNDLRTRLLAAGYVFCVCSLYSGVTIVNGRRRAIPRAAGILTPVVASTCGIGIDTQRHRKAPQI